LDRCDGRLGLGGLEIEICETRLAAVRRGHAEARGSSRLQESSVAELDPRSACSAVEAFLADPLGRLGGNGSAWSGSNGSGKLKKSVYPLDIIVMLGNGAPSVCDPRIACLHLRVHSQTGEPLTLGSLQIASRGSRG
jgi:hypothetical protein